MFDPVIHFFLSHPHTSQIVSVWEWSSGMFSCFGKPQQWDLICMPQCHIVFTFTSLTLFLTLIFHVKFTITMYSGTHPESVKNMKWLCPPLELNLKYFPPVFFWLGLTPKHFKTALLCRWRCSNFIDHFFPMFYLETFCEHVTTWDTQFPSAPQTGTRKYK